MNLTEPKNHKTKLTDLTLTLAVERKEITEEEAQRLREELGIDGEARE